MTQAPGPKDRRELTIRWRKGGTTVLILGLVYGVLEEGLILQTFYNPSHA